jgi:hypothetical protein
MMTSICRALGTALACAVSSAAIAAPFCTVSQYGTNCVYFDAPSCQQAAANIRGACVVSSSPSSPSAGLMANPPAMALQIKPPESYVDTQRKLADMRLAQAQAGQAEQARQDQGLQRHIARLVSDHKCAQAQADALAAGDVSLAAQAQQLCVPR